MKLLVLQHIACEHPASLRRFLHKDGIVWDTVQLDEGETLPELSNYDAMWVMGGPMDVWDVVQNPWLIPEKAAIRHWVRDLQRPYLGFCLGHQLLADALGGTCGPQNPPEIGVTEITLTEAGIADPLFQGLAQQQKCLQWHSVQVAQPPDDAVILASSDICPIQAMRIGNNAYSMQYHVEAEDNTVDDWAAIPAYRNALIETLGEPAIGIMQSDADAAMTEFLQAAEILYRNFMKISSQG